MPSRPPSGPPPSGVNYSRPKLRNQILFVFGILVLAGGAFYTALVVATQIEHVFFPDSQIRLPGTLAKLPGIDAGDASEINGSRINILVMGLDRRPSDGTRPSRTDTMFVLTIDPSTRSTRGLAMPRDLLVDIPWAQGNGSFKDRINTAYRYGEQNDYPGGGTALVRQTVENLLGLDIHYHVMIEFEGFKRLIDLIGGIDLHIPPPGVNDPYYSETERLGDYYPCVFEPGLYHMDGSDALCYARVRRNSSDLDRILRQQRIMFAVMDKATQLNVLANPTNIANLWRRYKDTIETDINDLQIPGFAKLAAAIDQEQIAFLSLGAATASYITPAGADVLLPSEKGIKQIVTAFLSDNRLLKEAAVVEVQNSTGVEGQAIRAVEFFTSLGIPNTSLVAVNDGGTSYTRTEVIDFSGKLYTAERLASWMGLPQDRVRKSTVADLQLRSSNADIIVILGTDATLGGAEALPSS